MNLRTEVPNNNNSLLPITGKLRFVADRCRSDVLVATGEISCGGDKYPSDNHELNAERTIKYLKKARELGIIFKKNDNMNLFGYTDASYVIDGKSKCRLGGCVVLGNNSDAILTYSRNDTLTSIPVSMDIPPTSDDEDVSTSTLSHSSCETEIKGADLLLREIIHIRDMLNYLGYVIDIPTPVYIDNGIAITFC